MVTSLRPRQWPKNAVVLAGRGRAFCAGADLKSAAPGQPQTQQRTFLDVFDLILEGPKPVIGRIAGHAVAGEGDPRPLMGGGVGLRRYTCAVRAVIAQFSAWRGWYFIRFWSCGFLTFCSAVRCGRDH